MCAGIMKAFRVGRGIVGYVADYRGPKMKGDEGMTCARSH